MQTYCTFKPTYHSLAKVKYSVSAKCFFFIALTACDINL